MTSPLTNFCADPETAQLRRKSKTAGNKKINANFLFGGFIASYESLCVIKQLCFPVYRLAGKQQVVCELPQIKNFVYPLCVICNLMGHCKGKMTAVMGIMEGTFTKPMPIGNGKFIQPTGKSFKLPMCTIGIWKNDGSMSEEYLFWDNQTYMNQLGLGK